MSKWRKAIQDNYVTLVNDCANPDDVAEYLYSGMDREILTESMKSEIKEKRTTKDKSREMLSTLLKRGPRALQGLYQAYTETGNEDLAELLIPYLEMQVKDDTKHTPSQWPPTKEEQERMEKDDVIKLSPKDPIVQLHYDSPEVYPMKSAVRGFALIINNEHFQKQELSRRVGTEKDSQNLKAVLEQLHFHVTEKCDATRDQILSLAKEFSQKEELKDHNCFLFAIFSHGNEEGIFGVDGQTIAVEKIQDCFVPINCPALNEKPKIFLIQACRGDHTKDQNETEEEIQSNLFEETVQGKEQKGSHMTETQKQEVSFYKKGLNIRKGNIEEENAKKDPAFSISPSVSHMVRNFKPRSGKPCMISSFPNPNIGKIAEKLLVGDSLKFDALSLDLYRWRLDISSKILLQAGHCPYYNSHQGQLDQRLCNSELPCPDDRNKTYKSYEAYHFPGCFQRYKTTTPPPTTTTTTTVTTTIVTGDGTTDSNSTTYNSTVSPSSDVGMSEMKETDFIPVIAVVCGLLLPVLSLLLICIICKKRRAERSDVEKQTVVSNKIEINDITSPGPEENHSLLGSSSQGGNKSEHLTESDVTPKKNRESTDADDPRTPLLKGDSVPPHNTQEYANTSGMSDVYFTPKKSMDDSGIDKPSDLQDEEKNKTEEDESVDDIPEDDKQYMLQLSAKLSGRILELFCTIIEKETGSSLEETVQNEEVKDYLKDKYEKDPHKLAALYDTSEGQNNKSVVIDRLAVPLEVWYCIIMDVIAGLSEDEKKRVKKLKLCRDYFQKTTQTKMEEFEEKRTEMTECVEYFDKKYGLVMCKAIKGEEEEIRRNIEMKRRGESADSVSVTSEVDHPNSDEEETVHSDATDTKKDKYMKVAHVIRGAVYDVLLSIAKSEADSELTEFLCREDIKEFLGDSLEPHEMSLYTEDGSVSTDYVTAKALFLIILQCMKPAPIADIKELKKGWDYFDSITGSEEEEEIKEKWITLAKSIKTLDDLYQTGVYLDLCYNAKQYMPSLQ